MNAPHPPRQRSRKELTKDRVSQIYDACIGNKSR